MLALDVLRAAEKWVVGAPSAAVAAVSQGEEIVPSGGEGHGAGEAGAEGDAGDPASAAGNDK